MHMKYFSQRNAAPFAQTESDSTTQTEITRKDVSYFLVHSVTVCQVYMLLTRTTFLSE